MKEKDLATEAQGLPSETWLSSFRKFFAKPAHKRTAQPVLTRQEMQGLKESLKAALAGEGPVPRLLCDGVGFEKAKTAEAPRSATSHETAQKSST